MGSLLDFKAGQEYNVAEVQEFVDAHITTETDMFVAKDGLGMVFQVRPNGNCTPIAPFRTITPDDLSRNDQNELVLADYKKGFDIMMEYFDSIADEEKPEVDRQLKEIGL